MRYTGDTPTSRKKCQSNVWPFFCVAVCLPDFFPTEGDGRDVTEIEGNEPVQLSSFITRPEYYLEC